MATMSLFKWLGSCLNVSLVGYERTWLCRIKAISDTLENVV